MTYKLYAYWSAPRSEEVSAFEEYYRSTHVPKASVVPGMLRLITARVPDGFEGGKSVHYRVVEMEFASREALLKASASPEWAEMRKCSGEIIERFGVSVSVEMGEIEDNALSARPLP
jgi:uncharacterized protein (TIGR02118 family)